MKMTKKIATSNWLACYLEKKFMAKSLTPKEALIAWAKANGVTPPQFTKTMGYSYNHAYQLLRGNSDVTFDLLGRFTVAYGPDAASQLMPTFQAKLVAAAQ